MTSPRPAPPLLPPLQAVEPAEADTEMGVPEAEAAVPENDENQQAPAAKVGPLRIASGRARCCTRWRRWSGLNACDGTCLLVRSMFYWLRQHQRMLTRLQASPFKVPPGSPEDRAPLRPSSRQDAASRAPLPAAKPASPLLSHAHASSSHDAAAAPADGWRQAPAAAPVAGEGQGAAEDAVASISILPSSQGEGSSRLVLLLGSSAALQGPAEGCASAQVAMVMHAAVGAVQVASLATPAEGCGEAAGREEEEVEVEDAVAMRGSSCEVEDAEAPLEDAAAEPEVGMVWWAAMA